MDEELTTVQEGKLLLVQALEKFKEANLHDWEIELLIGVTINEVTGG